MQFYRENFISIREAARLSQAELAEKLGVSQQAVQQWERGTSRPRPAKVYEAAKVLGVSAVDISDLKPETWLAREKPVDGDPLLAIIVDAWPELTPEDRGRLAGIAAGMLDAKKTSAG